MLTDWPNHPGFTVRELAHWRGLKSIGLICDRLLCIDVDGPTAIDRLIARGLRPNEAATWRVNRTTDPNRFKLIYRPTQQQFAQLPNGTYSGKETTKTKEEGSKGEAVEVFASPLRQVIVSGSHPSSGGAYRWPEGQGPEALAEPPAAWWAFVLEMARDFPKPAARANRTVTTSRGDWRRISNCPICQRDQSPVCQLHADGETLRCFRGSTFSPPHLQPGERLGEWEYKRDQDVGWAEFAIFRKVRPTLTARLRAMQESSHD